MIESLVLIGLLGVGFPFVAYPILLWLHAVLRPAEIKTAEIEPQVDLIIAAHNEEASIGARLENALALDYPAERLTIWIASDGSSDATVSISQRIAESITADQPKINVLDLPRGGKAAALIKAVSRCEGEVLAFSDANSDWQPDALAMLVRPLADASVGGVAGDQRYVAAAKSATEDATDSAAGERGYWSFDRALKRWQSQAGNAISATGAIYAIRRSLFEPPPPDATDDFMISTGVIAAGARLVFSEEAVALEPPAEAAAGEFRRKVRIITRGLRAVDYRRSLMNPGRTGLYALELIVHKLWRRLTWIPFALLAVLAPFAWRDAAGWLAARPAMESLGGEAIVLAFSVIATTAAATAVLVGILGLASPGMARIKPVSIAAYVVMVNAACALATWNAIRGTRVARWDTERVVVNGPGLSASSASPSAGSSESLP